MGAQKKVLYVILSEQKICANNEKQAIKVLAVNLTTNKYKKIEFNEY